MLDIQQKTGPNGFFTWVDHVKRPVPFGLRSFTMAKPGVKKPFGAVFYPSNNIYKCSLQWYFFIDDIYIKWEEHLLIHLTKFLLNNEIIHPNHHGGRQFHSTTSALLHITNNLKQQYDSDKITATLTTDLTSAFETVNTIFLLEKN